MKRQYFLLFASLFFLLLSAPRCTKDRFHLPPETTSGANTFGCKVNGKVFVPRDGKGKPGMFCQYVYLGEGGGWFLNIPAIDWKSSPTIGISITTDSLLLEENTTYIFKNTKGNAKAFYKNSTIYSPEDSNGGVLFISKHNKTQRILSGTFEFIGINQAGEKVEIREGRFDIVY